MEAGFTNGLLASDSKEAIHLIKEDTEVFVAKCYLVEDVQRQLNIFFQFSISFLSREIDKVAHYLARYALYVGHSKT